MNICSFVLLALMPWLILGKEECEDDTFDFELALIPAPGVDYLDCNEKETAYIAQVISHSVGSVFTHSLHATESVTNVCKNTADGESPPGRALGPCRSCDFVYRGTGRCRLCYGDDGDYRRMLLKTASSDSQGGLSSFEKDEELLFHDSMAGALTGKTNTIVTWKHGGHHSRGGRQLDVVSTKQEELVDSVEALLMERLGESPESEGICTFGGLGGVRIVLTPVSEPHELDCSN